MIVLGVLMRWLHIAGVVLLLGGVTYARWVLAPALGSLSPDLRRSVTARAAVQARGMMLGAVIAILGSGLYNFLTKGTYPPGYHMAFGIKMLLVLHIFAVAFLLAKPGADEDKRHRWMSGVIFSGGVVLVISAYLRWISLH